MEGEGVTVTEEGSAVVTKEGTVELEKETATVIEDGTVEMEIGVITEAEEGATSEMEKGVATEAGVVVATSEKEKGTTVTGDLCILCCCSLSPSNTDKTGGGGEGGDDAGGSCQTDNEVGRPEFVRFCKELVEIQPGGHGSGSEEITGGGGIVEDDEGSKMLSYFAGESPQKTGSGEGADPRPLPLACPNCLKIIAQVSTKKSAVDEGRARLRKLQLEMVAQLKELQGQLGEYHGEMKKVEEVVNNSDTSCLESYLEGNESLGDGGKAAVVIFRSWVSTASTDSQNYQDVAKRRQLMSTPELSQLYSPDFRIRSTDKYQLRKNPKKKKINPLDFLTLEVKAEGSQGRQTTTATISTTDVASVKSEKQGDMTKEAGVEDDGDEEYVQEEDDPYDYYLGDEEGSESSDWEDDEYDSDYCPSLGYQEEAMVEQQQYLDSLIEGEDPLQLAGPPPAKKKKKNKKKWKKKRLTRDVTEQVKDLGEFKAEVVKSVIRLQDKKERMRTKLMTAEINKPIDYLVDDPSVYYDIDYDFETGKMTLGHVEIMLDDQSQSLICTECAYSTSKLDNSTYKYKLSEKIRHLFYHILGKHLEAFKCAVCGTVVTTRARYKDHIKGHQLQFVCDHCGKPVSSKGALQTHKWHFHMTEEQIQQALANGEKDPRVRLKRFMEKQKQCVFQCSTCGKKFGTKTQLKTHMETHLDKSQRVQYMCPQCGKSFTKGSWISHQQNTCRPEGSFTFYCGQCPPGTPKGFASKALLKRHMNRVHPDKPLERPHPCPNCGKGFKTAGELKRHEVVHSDLRPFLCEHGCGASFKIKKHCTRHESTCKGNEGSWRGPRQSKMNKSVEVGDTITIVEAVDVDMDEKPQLKLPETMTLDIVSFS